MVRRECERRHLTLTPCYVQHRRVPGLHHLAHCQHPVVRLARFKDCLSSHHEHTLAYHPCCTTRRYVWLRYRYSEYLPSAVIVLDPRCCPTRYNEIAERAHKVQQRHSKAAAPAQEPEPFALALGQELYRTALFAVFLLQILAARLLPYVGALLPAFESHLWTTSRAAGLRHLLTERCASGYYCT